MEPIRRLLLYPRQAVMEWDGSVKGVRSGELWVSDVELTGLAYELCVECERERSQG